MPKFEIEDSWIFLSVARSSGSTLSDFYAVADHINAAIPTNHEIESSINRLVGCGLVSVEDNSFSLTARGEEIFQLVGGVSGYPRPQVQLAAPLLSNAMLSQVAHSSWHLHPDVAADARQEYFKRMQGAFKRIFGKQRPKDTN